MRRSWVGSNCGISTSKKATCSGDTRSRPPSASIRPCLKTRSGVSHPSFAMQQPTQPEPSYHHQFPRIRVNEFIAGFGHDEGVAEENAEIAICRDRVRLGHEHHFGPE